MIPFSRIFNMSWALLTSVLILGCSVNPMNTIGDMDDAQFSQFLQERQFKPNNDEGHFDPNTPLSPVDCTTDLAIWKRCIEEAQTTLYRHATKQQVDSAFAAAFKTCQAGPSYLEMLRLISKTQHLIACGHSGWSHSDAYKKHRNTAMRFFPLEVVNLQNSLYIKSSFSPNPAIEKGAEITRINGVETKEVLKKAEGPGEPRWAKQPRANIDPVSLFLNGLFQFY